MWSLFCWRQTFWSSKIDNFCHSQAISHELWTRWRSSQSWCKKGLWRNCKYYVEICPNLIGTFSRIFPKLWQQSKKWQNVYFQWSYARSKTYSGFGWIFTDWAAWLTIIKSTFFLNSSSISSWNSCLTTLNPLPIRVRDLLVMIYVSFWKIKVRWEDCLVLDIHDFQMDYQLDSITMCALIQLGTILKWDHREIYVATENLASSSCVQRIKQSLKLAKLKAGKNWNVYFLSCFVINKTTIFQSSFLEKSLLTEFHKVIITIYIYSST